MSAYKVRLRMVEHVTFDIEATSKADAKRKALARSMAGGDWEPENPTVVSVEEVR